MGANDDVYMSNYYLCDFFIEIIDNKKYRGK
jgi:hypothetical protein